MTTKVTFAGHEASHPPSVATRAAYVRAAILGGFARLVEEAGGDVTTLAARVGIPERALRDPDMVILWTAVGELMELAAHELQKPSLGLEWLRTARGPLLNFGAVALIARFTTTVGEWCAHSRNYWHHHTNGSSAELLELQPDGFLSLRVHFSDLIPPSRHQVEYILGGVCALLRTLTSAADDGIKLIRFRHARPGDTSLHNEFFPCPVEFGSAYDEIVHHRRLHEQPIELRPDILQNLLRSYIEQRTGAIPDYDGSTRANVEIAIPSLIGTDFCTQPHVAQLLGMGAKTLQRQLAKEGTHFAALLDKGRERMARHLLAESGIPVASIAGLLGYAQTPPFTTAVRRWTGMSARAFRNAAKGIPPADQARPEAAGDPDPVAGSRSAADSLLAR